MSATALIVFAVVALWLAAMLVAGLRKAAEARGRADIARPRPARTYAEVRRRRD